MNLTSATDVATKTQLERTTDQYAGEFCELIAGYDLSQRVCGPTHDAGGTLDVVGRSAFTNCRRH